MCEDLSANITCFLVIPFIYHIQVQFTVEISYFEIYNEKIHDLLAPSKKKDNKKVQVNFYLVYCLIVTSVLARISKLGIN